MRLIRWIVLVAALTVVALPQTATAAGGSSSLRSADSRRDKLDRVLVVSAVTQRKCAASSPTDCATPYRRLQRAGRALERAEAKLVGITASSARARVRHPQQTASKLRHRNGRLRWHRIKGVASYVVLRQAQGMADSSVVVRSTRMALTPVPGAAVTYRVRTVAQGSTWSNPVVVTYHPKPRSDSRSAPVVATANGNVTWARVGKIRGYIVVRKVPGRLNVYTSVQGTSLGIKPAPGATVSYSVRTAVPGSTWSPVVSVAFPAAAAIAVPPAGPTAQAASVPGNPFANQKLYVDPNSNPVQTQRQLLQAGNATDAVLMGKIASQPIARWFGNWSQGHGSTAGDVNWWVTNAATTGSMPVLVAYNIPGRDCGQYSAGGAASPEVYRAFVDGMVQGIAGRKVAVIVEPDAVAQLDCRPADQQSATLALLDYAVSRLASSPNTAVYLDAGHSTWKPAATMITRLQQAGIAKARGFSVNVSNFNTTAAETAYATAIAAGLPGKHAVLDTSRNGKGPGGGWCNPSGRGLGAQPTAQTTTPTVDAYLWIKTVGESDGTCNGGPAAGGWWPSYALELARNAPF